MAKKALKATGETAEALDARLEEVERKLDRLRALYESFFMGIERTPPAAPRRDLNRLMLELQQTPIGNASMRFRFQGLLQKWVLLTTYWNRTLREIEAGTYRRDIARAQRHLAERGPVLTEDEAIRIGIPSTRAKAFVAQQRRLAERRAAKTPAPVTPAPAAAPATPSPAAAPAAAASAEKPAPIPGLGEAEFTAFYEKYVAAHVSAVGAPPRTSAADLRAKLTADIPRILADKRASRVELDVVVEGGKVRLRARPVR